MNNFKENNFIEQNDNNPIEVAEYVDNIMKNMQEKFNEVNKNVNDRLDSFGNKIDSIENSINELINDINNEDFNIKVDIKE